MPKAADDFADIAARMKARSVPLAFAQDEGQDDKLRRLQRALVAQDAEVARIDREAAAMPGGITPASEANERAHDEANNHWWALVDEISATRAQGVPGQRAKAATMLLVLHHVVCGIGESIVDIAAGDVGLSEHRLMVSLATDLLEH